MSRSLQVIEQGQLGDGRIRFLRRLQGELFGRQLGGRGGVVHILQSWTRKPSWSSAGSVAVVLAAVMALMRAPTEALTSLKLLTAASICSSAVPTCVEICAELRLGLFSVVIRLESVLNALEVPAGATVKVSPAAGVPVTVVLMPLKAIVPGLVKVPPVTVVPALLVTV